MSSEESDTEIDHTDPRVKRGNEGDIFILQDEDIFQIDNEQAHQLIIDLSDELSNTSDGGDTETPHENGVCPECGHWQGVGVGVSDGIAFKCARCQNVWKEASD